MQVYNNKDVFRAILYSPLDFESPPWDTISGKGPLPKPAGSA